jgi:integrase
MAGRQAKILHEQQINDLLVFASATRNPLRNKLIVLLSVKAGLRAGEIAGLTWDMVLDPTGEVGQAIELHDCIAKKNSGRRIPVNPALRTALTAWCLLTGDAGRVIRSERGDAMRCRLFACERVRPSRERSALSRPRAGDAARQQPRRFFARTAWMDVLFRRGRPNARRSYFEYKVKYWQIFTRVVLLGGKLR